MFIVALLAMAMIADDKLNELIANHERMLSQMHSLEIELKGTGPRGTVINRYWCSGSQHRCVIQPADNDASGITRIDSSTDRRQTRLLQNWYSDDKRQLSPREQRGVRGSMGPAGSIPGSWYRLARGTLLLSVESPWRGSIDLCELPDRAGTCKYVGTEAVDGSTSEVIESQFPEESADRPAEAFRIYLDPSRGFLICRVIRTVPRLKVGAEFMHLVSDSRIVTFQDVQRIPFPIKVATTVTLTPVESGTAKPRVEHSTVEVTKLRLNEPVDEAKLVTRFPPGLLVAEPPQGGSRVVHYWGEDGPNETFRTKQEYDQFMARFPVPVPQLVKQSVAFAWPFIGAAAVLCTLLAVLVYIRRRRRELA